MTTNAYIKVCCDECDRKEEIALARNSRGWDEEDVNEDIEALGWNIVDENTHHCPSCVEALRGGKDTQ